MRSVDAYEPGRARFAILADDLTGACDSAVAFARRGLAVKVLLEKEALAPVDGVWAISTESRDLPVDAAIQRICDSASQVSQANEVFKKVDSTFRGNTFAEVRAAIDCLCGGFAVLSPAYPLMGRVVRDGVLHIRDAGGDRSIDLRNGLRLAGVNNLSSWNPKGSAADLTRTMKAAVDAGCKILLCDAELKEDLQAAVSEARSIGKPVLWIGSGGLAEALACELPGGAMQPTREPSEGIVVLFVGSDHAVTRRQVEALRSTSLVLESPIEDFSGAAPEYELVILNVTRGLTTEEQIRSAMAHLSPRRIACCVMTGGDTAMLVCRALGVRSLSLTEEFAPGLPQGVAEGGMLHQSSVILKSGGFGKEDVLCQLSQRFGRRKEFA